MSWLAVGLGNPGEKYRLTRHNAGARAVERLADDLGASLRPPKARLRPGKPPASVAEASTPDGKLIIARPSTFMNESGRAVGSLTRWFKVPAENLIVVHDDIDLASGALIVKKGGGSGGHNGINSIAKALGSTDFFRVRIGVGRPPSAAQEPADLCWRTCRKAPPRFFPTSKGRLPVRSSASSRRASRRP